MRNLIQGHFTMPALLCMDGHCLMLLQLPVLKSESCGKRTTAGSRSKDSMVLSLNTIEMASTLGSISTDSTVLPLISGKRRNLERRLRECVRLRSAMIRLSLEGDLWSGPHRCVNTGAARCRYRKFSWSLQGKSDLPKNYGRCPINQGKRPICGQS